MWYYSVLGELTYKSINLSTGSPILSLCQVQFPRSHSWVLGRVQTHVCSGAYAWITIGSNEVVPHFKQRRSINCHVPHNLYSGIYALEPYSYSPIAALKMPEFIWSLCTGCWVPEYKCQSISPLTTHVCGEETSKK